MNNYNYSPLKGRIIEKLGSQSKLAEKLNVSEVTLSFKLNNRYDFTQSEITQMVGILEIPHKEIFKYFFQN